ncbi:PepSY domain-containing protein [uncultured Alsobacter sp.]|uniref:PepSY domain-containing protein n=1 Tax=uncultured Alsobacter sp. TaxID=1748258 RepID=UPI0025D970AC|nr:PepSY domain-containing protein [uncultured Alsobacter sp.]
MSSVLAKVRETVEGSVLQVDLSGAAGAWRYEVLVLSTDGRYREVLVDAQNNRVLGVRRR